MTGVLGGGPSLRGAFRADEEARGAYAESAGVQRRLPRAVAVPADADDVVRLVRWAGAEGIPLVPRGSGSSMAGGAVGPDVVVDLSRLRGLDAVDAGRRRVRAEAGVLRGEVERAANAAGLRFPVDPSSGAFATIGGMAATNAAGARTLRHGAMRAWVDALDCVFADGTRAVVRRGARAPEVAALAAWHRDAARWRAAARALPPRGVRKESSGYGVQALAEGGDLVDLLVGSEGTLALFVAAELRLAPLPLATASLLASWPTLEAAVEGARVAREAGASACELLDRTFLTVAREAGALPVPDGAACVLLVELEGDGGMASAATALAEAFRRAGASAVTVGLDPETEASLWALRHAASPILSRLADHLASMQVVEDGCVPPERLADYVRGVRAALDRSGLRGVIFGHAGDAHVHVNALVDVRRPGWRDQVATLYESVVALTASLGGTLAGEHGDGRLRTPAMARTWSPAALALFGEIKAGLDPAGVLNPGVKVPRGPTDALGGNKYDPALPALPPRARAVLARVERERAYAQHRLEMLDRQD